MRRRSCGLRPPHLPSKVSNRRRRELALIFALVFGVGAGGSRLAAAPVPFATPPAISSSADGAVFVFAGDVDGDGDLDALSASSADDTIAWFENVDGDGSSWVEDVVTTEADSAGSVFAADVDGDGDLDVLSSSGGDDKIAWYENAGDGSGWDPTTITVLADNASSVVAGDVDGDGDTDVVSASTGDDKIAWYENANGAGTAWTPRTIASGTAVDNASRVVTVDVDGDGDLDVASASFLADTVAWHENTNGIGTAWTTRNVFTDANGARGVTAADLDGDGDVDLVSASVGDDRVRWHENLNGQGTSWSTATITTLAVDPFGVFAADVDGDGDVDALSASRGDDGVAWYENTSGTGSSWTRHLLTSAAGLASSVLAGDVDGDGDLDVLAAAVDDDTIAWFDNRTIHRSALLEERLVITSIADAVSSVFAADVDGDGDLDALFTGAASGEVAWQENVNANGTSWTSHIISTPVQGPRSALAADVDGDGDLDALAALEFEDAIEWYENDVGNGTTWTERTIAAGVDQPNSVFAADVDGDGDLDVLSALFVDEQILWHENDLGATPTWASHTIATGVAQAISVFAADVDGDGDVDALSASRDDDEIAWYENVGGSGTSWAPDTVTGNASGARSVFAADLDGDGDVDALSASEFDDTIRWYENEEGDGSSWIERTIASTADGARSVFAADLDADGDLDALSASELDDEVAWYENLDGSGTSWAPQTIASNANGANSVFAADIDGDGDVDALSTSIGDDTIAWYPNRGGQFALPTTALAQGVLANSQEDAVLQIDLEHRGRAGDSDVELDTLELHFGSGGFDLTGIQADSLVAKLELFLDDGSGSFGLPGDTLVESIDAFGLVSGVETIELAGLGPEVEVPFGESKRYFVVVTMTPNAASQTPDSFELTHLTVGSSSARDASTPTAPLRLEHHPDTSTGPIDTDLSTTTCKAPFELELESFLVTTDVVCEAGTTITAGNGLTVSPSGDLTLRAGQQVRFVVDFSVQSGGGLVTEVDPSLVP